MEVYLIERILTAQKAEVIQVVLETFDQEKYEKAMKREWYDEGFDEGYGEGYGNGRNKERENGICQLITVLLEMQEKYHITEDEIQAELISKYSLTPEEAESYLRQYGR